MFLRTQRFQSPGDSVAPARTHRLLHGFGLLAAAAAFAVSFAHPDAVEAEPRTKVMLNGKPTAVYFNDGDSFRVLQGEFAGAKARLSGYNTLESYGAVHQWGNWHEHELYVVAKMATLYARRGTWTCESDGKLDTYGRLLVWCPDLAKAQVRKGHAHVMSIDDNPGRPELLEAQKAAIADRVGIWAHGVPAFILTSLHSAEEDTEGHGTYNRLVSSDDAHSVKWKHDTKYSECTKVCHMVYAVDEAKVDEVTTALKAASEVSAIVGRLDDATLRAVVREFAEFHHIARAIDKDRREELKTFLLGWVEEGRFGDSSGTEGACMIHVPFERRFGGGRAACLK